MGLARIGIGSNCGDAVAQVRAAFTRLADLGRITARSSLFRTAPWGVTEQPAFINAAALLETALAPHALLTALKAIETELGRVATYRGASEKRTRLVFVHAATWCSVHPCW